MAKKNVSPDKILHGSLMCLLDGMLTEKELDTMKKLTEIWEALPRSTLTKLTTFVKFWDELERHGCIKVGDYSFLVEQLMEMKLVKYVKIIEEHQEKIKHIQAQATASPSAPRSGSVEGLEERVKVIEDRVKDMHLSKRESDTTHIPKDDGKGKTHRTPAPQIVHGNRKTAPPPDATAQTRTRDVRRCQLVFEKTYTAEKDEYITSIANLGSLFAVAHPRKLHGSRENRIDIFISPNNLIHTITENISGLYWMAATKDGNLAVLRWKGGTTYCVNTFDPETASHLGCSQDFLSGDGLRSFDVNFRGEYYLLDTNDDITFGQDKGSLVQSQSMGKGSLRISCGVKYVYIYHNQPEDHIAAYEVKGNRLVHVTRSEAFERVFDISATFTDEVTVTCRRGSHWYLARSAMREGRFSEWQFQEITLESKFRPYISVRGDHIVISRNRTIQVFAEESN